MEQSGDFVRQMELADFWEKKVGKGHKHFVDTIPPEKKANLIRRFREHLLHFLIRPNVKSVVDWGCGGGLLANILADYFELTIADIAEESIRECIRYVNPHRIRHIIVVPSDIDSLVFDIKCSAIHCSDVVHHFPSRAYWYKVVQKWMSLEPKLIAMNAKLGEDKDSANYFEGQNYIEGLVMDKETVIKSFPAYELIKFNSEKALNSAATFGFFVFARR